MEVITREKYLKVCFGRRDGYFRLEEDRLNRLKFSVGDVVHIIDYHYLEDEHGNDIDQDILFVNPSIITGVYRITGVGCLDDGVIRIQHYTIKHIPHKKMGILAKTQLT